DKWLCSRVPVAQRHMDEKEATAPRSLLFVTTNCAKKNAGVSCSLASYLKMWSLPLTLRRWTAHTSCHRRKPLTAPCYRPGRCWWNTHSRPRLSLAEEFAPHFGYPLPDVGNAEFSSRSVSSPCHLILAGRERLATDNNGLADIQRAL